MEDTKTITREEAFFLARRSMHNEERLKKAKTCGCYHCAMVFDVSVIDEWVDDPPRTAICPYCGIDSVIDSEVVKPFTPEVLERISESMF